MGYCDYINSCTCCRSGGKAHDNKQKKRKILLRLWLRMRGLDTPFTVEWEDINLQDQVEEAKAELYRRQAERLARDRERSD